jgi:chromosome segregation ATPase
MDKRQKTIFYAGIGVVAALVVLAVALIFTNSRQSSEFDQVQTELDSLRFANDQLKLTNEFNQLNADFKAYEDQQIYLKNDSLVQKYDQARLKVEALLKELNAEKRSNSQNKQKIKNLEAEIATLKGIVKHYLAEIKRLGEENEGLRKEIEEISQKNEQLSSAVTTATTKNEELTQKVQLAEKLTLTGVSLQAFNEKGKAEKKVKKAKTLGVSLTITPNNTAKPGLKDVYVRITSPEGNLLKGNGSFSAEGTQLEYTTKRQVEYANEELSTVIYWDVNTSLTAGEYTVEIFIDGNRLTSRRFTLN